MFLNRDTTGGGRCSSSFLQGTRPRKLGHPDVTTDDTAPPHAQALLGRAGAPSESDIRVPSRVLSAAKQGESGAPERVGSPVGA